MSGRRFELGPLEGAVGRRLAAWRQERVAERLWARDHTLWFSEPRAELTDRLGWLDLPEAMPGRADELQLLADAVRDDGIDRVVLLGMGGSSLAPEMFQRTFGNAVDRPELTVLDSTHPGAVNRLTGELNLARTGFVVASKSGGTVETLSLFRHFWTALEKDPGRGARFLAITDPGSALETLGRERGFRAVVTAPADVGGRFSALCPFGLLPAALIGVDTTALLASARRGAALTHTEEGPAFTLGAVLGGAAAAGRDKLTLITSPRLAAVPAWLEQLVAESLGKQGRGVVPVIGEPLSSPSRYGRDRLFVRLRMDGEHDRPSESALDALAAAGHPVIRLELGEPLDLGGELLSWEIAVAMAGAVLGVNPFDQPDVQLAKQLAKRAMAGGGETAAPPASPAATAGDALARLLDGAAPGGYVAVQAFLAPSPETDAGLAALRRAFEGRTGLPVTVGYGPRFLHSTGQLHKGGPDGGVFLQLVDEPAADLAIPETAHSFGGLIAAQAAGDAAALAQRGRPALRLNLGGDPEDGLFNLAATV